MPVEFIRFFKLSTLSCLLALASHVSAHGFPSHIIVGSSTYSGAQSSATSPVRKVSVGDPVLQVTSNDIICGWNAASSASQSIDVNPGDLVQIYWQDEGTGPWPHLTGPVSNYMASCSGSCSSFTPSSSTAWFKTAEWGKSVADTNTWVQGNIEAGAPVNVTIPSNIPPGNYLMRHEILSLQNAMSQGLAEFYPSCIQFNVGGNGNGSPGNTVNFPGAYSPTDPGILVNIYNDPSTPYSFPGGPVSNIKDPLSDTNDAVSGAVSIPSGPPSSSSSSSLAPSASSDPSNTSPSESPTNAPNPSSSTPSLDPTPTSGSPINVAPSPSPPSQQCSLNTKSKRAALVDPGVALASEKKRALGVHRKRKLTMY